MGTAGGWLPRELQLGSAALSWWRQFPEFRRIRRDIEFAGVAGARPAAAQRARSAVAATAGTAVVWVDIAFPALLDFRFYI